MLSEACQGIVMQRVDYESSQSSKTIQAFFVTEKRVKLFRNNVTKKEDHGYLAMKHSIYQ